MSTMFDKAVVPPEHTDHFIREDEQTSFRTRDDRLRRRELAAKRAKVTRKRGGKS